MSEVRQNIERRVGKATSIQALSWRQRNIGLEKSTTDSMLLAAAHA
jgi:hypothetical protein